MITHNEEGAFRNNLKCKRGENLSFFGFFKKRKTQKFAEEIIKTIKMSEIFSIYIINLKFFTFRMNKLKNLTVNFLRNNPNCLSSGNDLIPGESYNTFGKRLFSYIFNGVSLNQNNVSPFNRGVFKNEKI